MASWYAPATDGVFAWDGGFREDVDACGHDIVVFVQTHGELLFRHLSIISR